MPFQFKTKPTHRSVPDVQSSETIKSTNSDDSDLNKMTSNDNVIDLRNMENEIRVIENSAGSSTIVVENVTGCRLSFPFCTRAIHLRRVCNSTIVLLPVHTSILLDSCHNVELVAAAQQLRVHSSTRLKLFVHAATAVIIEECTDVSVAPYRLDGASLDHLKKALTDEKQADQTIITTDETSLRAYSSESANWSACAEPRDFDCVVGVSPNWCRLDESLWKIFSLL